jgi:hypothetical protein
MTFNLDGLHAVAEHKPSTRESWRPPTIDDLGFGIVIAFDQTLSATAGMCVHRKGDGLVVRGVKMMAGVAADRNELGNEGNLQKGVTLYHRFIEFLMSMKGHHPDEQITVVHEAPSVGGGTIRHPESSLLAAQALRIAADRLDLPVAPMVTSSAHKKAVCGDARADKAKAHRSLALLAEAWPIEGYHRVSNGDKRDALCIGITHLMRSK